MKTRVSTITAVLGVLVAVSATDLLAAGRGNGGSSGNGGYGKRDGSCGSQSQQTATGSTTATRPAGAQRRDGTFLTSGVTANGSTVRPGNGKGLQDGSNLSTASTTPAQ